MPRPRSAMRKIRELLRLALGEGLSRRQVAAATGMPGSTVGDHLTRARLAGLDWPLPDDLDDAALEARLFVPVSARPPAELRAVPDWPTVHKELRRKGVTRELLWLEYRERHPEGFGYSWFCQAYRRWQGGLDLVMRQEHRAGEKTFVDFPGMTLPIVDPDTGEVWPAQLLVAVLGASSYTYAEALASQALPDWISGHVHAFEAFGGCSAIVVPDNLRSGVTRPHRYEPDINRTYVQVRMCGITDPPGHASGRAYACSGPLDAGQKEWDGDSDECGDVETCRTSDQRSQSERQSDARHAGIRSARSSNCVP